MAKSLNVRALRKKLNLSQRAFADQLQVDQSTLHRWETGAQTPRGPAQILLKMIAEQQAATPTG